MAKKKKSSAASGRTTKSSKSSTKKASSKQQASGRPAKKKAKKARRRELIDTGTDKRFVRRDEHGQFDEVDDVGRSLSQDRKRKAKTTAKPGQGDKGDRPTKKKSKRRR